jgi:hypothetical protein
MYMVAVPLGVVDGEKLPHCALPQVTFQVTPALALSLPTTAVRFALVPPPSDAGGAGLSETVMGAPGAEMVMVATAVLVESVTDDAVMVIEAGLGTVAGAVYTVAAPLAVFAAEKAPQCALPQATLQATPAFALSLLTMAVRLAVLPASTESGGWGLMLMLMLGGGFEPPSPPQPAIPMARARAEMK